VGLELGLAGRLPRAWIQGASGALLPFVAYLAGLLASLSPCVLPLVPLNLALIGADGARGWQAAARSGRFVLGAAATLAVLGLATDAAGFLLIEERGPVLLGSGLLMVLLAAFFLELLPMPWAGRAPATARKLGPIAAGGSFALVTSPCASPLLGAILAAAAAQGHPGGAVLAMLAFSLGYTTLVFLAGVAGGGVVARLRRRSFAAPRAAAGAVLLAAGLGFSAAGFAWL